MTRNGKNPGERVTALAYFRTSSAANVGDDKDTLLRQRAAVETYAAHQGLEIVREFYDAAVSGADPIDQRPGFTDLLTYVQEEGVQTILVENATRFARDLTVQLAGHDLLKREGIHLIPVDAPSHFTDDTPTAVLVRQVLGAISQFDKAQIVAKLKAARDRKSAQKGRRIEGRKGYGETHPELVSLAKRLNHGNRKKRLSLRAISAALAEQGYTTALGKPFSAQQVKRLLAG